MKSIFLLSIFAIFLCPVKAKCYVLDGLDYRIDSHYELMTYEEIINSLDGTNQRLATSQEMITLFNHYFDIHQNTTVGVDYFFQQIANEFPVTLGLWMDNGENYGVSFIMGRLQLDDGQEVGPYATINATIILAYVEGFDAPSRVVELSWALGFANLHDNTMEGMAAWIVTPVTQVPEPSTSLLFIAGLMGICAASRKGNKN